MKRKSLSTNLELKKSVIAELSNKETRVIIGGSTATTSAIREWCATINPLNCTMSAECAY